MNAAAVKPKFLAVDHVSRTVPDIAAAVQFYVDCFGATVLFQIGPIDAADIPVDAHGNDWMETHVGVKGARLTLAMLQLLPNLKLQLVQYDKPVERNMRSPRNCDLGGHHVALLVDDVGAATSWLESHGCKALEPIAMDQGPLAGKTNVYVRDPWGLYFELVD